MINKVHFGRRIAALRKRQNLSQSDLSEKLGVSPQAVSKWECGGALPDIDILLELSHLYGVTINAMLEDADLIYQLTGVQAGRSGIAYFVRGSENGRLSAWEKEIAEGRYIERNWAEAAKRPYMNRDVIGRQIAERGGTIVEIGAGPGGGYMPYILMADPDAAVVISDISPAVVREWKAFLDKTLDPPSVSYAVIDFCNMPFKDCSIDTVSDGGGIGNCFGDRRMALKEAYRVLKKGGMLVTATGFVNRETLEALPQNVQDVLLRERPDIFDDLYEDTVLAGFGKIDSVIDGCWYTDDDDSEIADLARSLGVNLKFTSYTRFCYKL